MTFLSFTFLIWMGGIVFIYLLLPKKYQLPFISSATFIALLSFSPWSGVALFLLVVVTYYVTNISSNNILSLYLIIFISIVFVSYKLVLRESALSSDQTGWLLLGASFYVLKAVHYIIESYKNNLQQHRFIEYLNYMFFFPVILVGPINRFDSFLREQRRRRWDSVLFATGLERILYGYVKTVIVADLLVAKTMYWMMSHLSSDHIWLHGYLSCLDYGLNLYFKFSGYSDIAIGFALLLGIRIMENFHYPFLQSNISQFWKSWHISLSSWCRDYVYMPIAAHFRRPYLGIIASMIVLGLWHELSLKYVLWGMYHGLGVATWQIYQRLKPHWLTSTTGPAKYIYHYLSIFLTFNFVVLSFQITKSQNIFSTIINSFNNLTSVF